MLNASVTVVIPFASADAKKIFRCYSFFSFGDSLKESLIFSREKINLIGVSGES